MSKENVREKLQLSQDEAWFKDFWLLTYSQRNFYLKYQTPEAADKYCDTVFDSIKKLVVDYCPEFNLDEKIVMDFINSIVYEFHKSNEKDNFSDLLYDVSLYEYGFTLERLTLDEYEFIREIHSLTVEYGFLVLLLISRLDDTLISDLFIKETFGKKKFPLFPYPKKNTHPNDIQISIAPYKSKISNNWDLLVYCSVNQKLNVLEQQIKNIWGTDHQNQIGDKKTSDFALFIDSTCCTQRKAIMVLRGQKKWLEYRDQGGLVYFINEEGSNKTKKVYPRVNSGSSKVIDDPKALLDVINYCENLNEKRWPVEINNIRRAIGIILWDQVNSNAFKNKSRRAFIIELIEKLESSRPEVLKHYHTSYDKKSQPQGNATLGSTHAVRETVIKGMQDDYKLAEYCILKAEYLPYSFLRKKTK
jgi:hypothetical protein